MRARQGCFKCGRIYTKIDRTRHRCYWGMYKMDAKCTVQGCSYAAALCIEHEDAHNYSPNLLNWLRWKGIKIDTPITSSADRGSENTGMLRTLEDTTKNPHHNSRNTMSDFRLFDRKSKESNRNKVETQEERLFKTQVTQRRTPKFSYEGKSVRFAPDSEERVDDEKITRAKRDENRQSDELPEKSYVQPKMRDSSTQTSYRDLRNQVRICNCYWRD